MKRFFVIAAIVVGLVVVGLGVGAFLEHRARQASLATPATLTVDRIVVEKARHRMTLLDGDKVVRRYRIALGGDPEGHKRREGDGRTPEGVYRIDFRNSRSDFHLSLRISYPDAKDRAAAQKRGAPPGGDIFIHGEPNRIGWLLSWAGAAGLVDRGDWTDGCIAVTNPEIREIWANVRVGTPIEIRP